MIRRFIIMLWSVMFGSMAQAQAQDTLNVQDYFGFWQLHSSSGYHGSLSMDGIGGCSYFVTSVFITVQATCVVRELPDGTLMIFGTQEGSSTSTPAYGDQLTVPRAAGAANTTLNMIITKVEASKMKGHIIAGGKKETIRFWR